MFNKIYCSFNVIYTFFKIYGNRLLFITEDADTEKITGIFTKDDHSIQRYKDFFDKLWDSSAVSTPNPSQATEHVSLQDLFKSDDVLPEVKVEG